MHAPQNVSIYLNNALKPTPRLAELDSDNDLPEVIRDMPEQVSGQLVDLDEPTTQEIAVAWKRVMMLNQTHVLYTFTFDPVTGKFSARKR